MRRKDTGGKEQLLVENCIAPQFDINSEDTDDLSPTYEKNHFFRCCTCRHCQNYNELQWLLIQLVWKDSPDPWDRCLHPSSILSSTVPCCCVQQVVPNGLACCSVVTAPPGATQCQGFHCWHRSWELLFLVCTTESSAQATDPMACLEGVTNATLGSYKPAIPCSLL